MFKIKCIIVEDEPLATKILSDYIGQVTFLELTGTFKDAISVSEFLHQNPVDLIFLDIHLPKLKGIAFLKTITNPPAIVITTAYHQYAVDGFNLNVTDYLLKPFEFERFLAAVNKVRLRHDTKPGDEEKEEKKGKKDYIFISVQKKKVKISFPDVLYVESQREYVKIVTVKQTFLSKMTTQEIESILPEQQFKRIHRSFIVSLSKIDSFTSESVEVNGTSIPVGRGYQEVIDKFLKS